MASGRPDYWSGMLTGKAMIVTGQKKWHVSATAEIALRSFETLVTYDVPVNYRLNITCGIITADHPGINKLYIYVNDVLTWWIFFDQTQIMPFNDTGTVVLDEGDELKLMVVNSDFVDVSFGLTLLGFLEKIVT